MEFNEKLQILRKEKGMTQDELAESLYVSRAAVSKWESGRGYPNIDSLKAIAQYFGITIDELLSGEAILSIAQEDAAQKRRSLCDLVFGCLDCSFALFFFLPLFGETASGNLREVSVMALTQIQPWLKVSYLAAIIAMPVIGTLTFALQNQTVGFWPRNKIRLSLFCNVAVSFLFILSRQPYAAAFALLFLIMKVLILSKKG